MKRFLTQRIAIDMPLWGWCSWGMLQGVVLALLDLLLEVKP